MYMRIKEKEKKEELGKDGAIETNQEILFFFSNIYFSFHVSQWTVSQIN